jgi:hypothetical protein
VREGSKYLQRFLSRQKRKISPNRYKSALARQVGTPCLGSLSVGRTQINLSATFFDLIGLSPVVKRVEDHFLAKKYVTSGGILPSGCGNCPSPGLSPASLCCPLRLRGSSQRIASNSSTVSRRTGLPFKAFRNSRSNAGVVATRNLPAIRVTYFLDLAAARRSPARNSPASRAFPRRYSS